jgi:hypothetical protein
MPEDISKKTNKELVKMTKQMSSSQPQQAQAELTKRLIDGIDKFNLSTENYSRASSILAIVMFFVSFQQLIISIISTPLKQWQQIPIFVIYMGSILCIINWLKNKD